MSHGQVKSIVKNSRRQPPEPKELRNLRRSPRLQATQQSNEPSLSKPNCIQAPPSPPASNIPEGRKVWSLIASPNIAALTWSRHSTVLKSLQNHPRPLENGNESNNNTKKAKKKRQKREKSKQKKNNVPPLEPETSLRNGYELRLPAALLREDWRRRAMRQDRAIPSR